MTYKFGDFTRAAITAAAGYKFGDITRGVIGNLGLRGSGTVEKKVELRPLDEALKQYFDLTANKKRKLSQAETAALVASTALIDKEMEGLQCSIAVEEPKVADDYDLPGEEKKPILDRLVAMRGHLIYLKMVRGTFNEETDLSK